MSIEENVALVRRNIASAAAEAGRNAGEILLVAATKMNDAGRIQRAIAAGVDVCGENRVQEMLEKNALGPTAGRRCTSLVTFRKTKSGRSWVWPRLSTASIAGSFWRKFPKLLKNGA